MVKPKVIKSINLYESNQPNTSGYSLPHDFGKIYISEPSFHFSATRIARKLNEIEFSLGDSDHLYLNFSPLLATDEIEISSRKPESWMLYINIGLDVESFNQLNTNEQEAKIIQLIFESLLKTSKPAERSKIETCKKEVEKYGKLLKINFKSKETKAYKITASYQIAPEDINSLLIISYFDKKTNEVQIFNQIIRVYEDAYALIKKITVKKNSIEIQAKNSFKAELYSDVYKTPLIFELNS